MVLLFALALLSVGLVALYRVLDPPVTPYQIAQGRAVPTTWTPLEEIPRSLLDAVLAAEDQRFCSHQGIDVRTMEHLLTELAEDRELPRGGSTISQQTAKNTFLLHGRSTWSRALRKPFEAWFTVWMELLWTKPRIMEVYLNVIEFGPGTFGVHAASQVYFGRSPAKLTRGQAAQLAATIRSPKSANPSHPSRSWRWYVSHIDATGPRVASLGLDRCLLP